MLVSPSSVILKYYKCVGGVCAFKTDKKIRLFERLCAQSTSVRNGVVVMLIVFRGDMFRV